MPSSSKRRPSKRRARKNLRVLSIIGLALAAIATVALVKIATEPATPPPSAAEEVPFEVEPVVHESIGVVGDSYTQGYGLRIAGQAFPYYTALNMGIRYEAVSQQSSGWVRPGVDGETLGNLIDSTTGFTSKTILLTGGLNDAIIEADPDEVTAAVTSGVAAAQALHPDARIIVVGPFSPGEPNDELLTIRDAVAAGATSAGVSFIDASTWLPADQLQSDELHPTVVGAQSIGSHLSEALTDLGIYAE